MLWAAEENKFSVKLLRAGSGKSMQKFRLDNKISMVTGGSRGIGFGIARALVEAGSHVVLVARTESQLRRAQEILV